MGRSGMACLAWISLTVACIQPNPLHDGYLGEDEDSTDAESDESSDGTGETDCSPQAEVCDGIDNDCDGKTDEHSDENGGCNGCKSILRGTTAYYFCPIVVDWETARGGCGAFGAQMVSILDKEENDFVRGGFDMSAIGEAWTGLNDRADEGSFVWDDGSALGFQIWKTDQPDDFEGAEDCVEMELDGVWNDLDCADTRSGYACKDVDP